MLWVHFKIVSMWLHAKQWPSISKKFLSIIVIKLTNQYQKYWTILKTMQIFYLVEYNSSIKYQEHGSQLSLRIKKFIESQYMYTTKIVISYEVTFWWWVDIKYEPIFQILPLKIIGRVLYFQAALLIKLSCLTISKYLQF